MFTKEEYLHFLDTIGYPKCKIEEFLIIKFNKKLNTFKPLESNQQINTILKTIKNINRVGSRTNSFVLENRLLEILTKKYPYYSFYSDIREKLDSFKNDDEVFKYIRKNRFYHKKINKHKHIIPPNLCDARKSLTENLFYEIKDHVKNIKNYLDIGAGDGAKTYYFSQQLGLEKENVFGLDFVTFHSVDYLENRTKNINFIDLKVDDKKYPIKSNSFDMVSAFMVAHHIKNLELFFLEINRILKKGKYFILMEHNNFTMLDDMLADIEHSMYEMVEQEKPNYSFKKEEYTQYYDWITWSIIAQKYNLQFVKQGKMKSTITSSLMPTSTCYILFKKI